MICTSIFVKYKTNKNRLHWKQIYTIFIKKLIYIFVKILDNEF